MWYRVYLELSNKYNLSFLWWVWIELSSRNDRIPFSIIAVEVHWVDKRSYSLHFHQNWLTPLLEAVTNYWIVSHTLQRKTRNNGKWNTLSILGTFLFLLSYLFIQVFHFHDLMWFCDYNNNNFIAWFRQFFFSPLIHLCSIKHHLYKTLETQW